jgi:hypothetical protein
LPGDPFHHISSIANRDDDLIGTYGTAYVNGAARPIYVILPPFKDNAPALFQVLDTLAEMRSELFPGVPASDHRRQAKNSHLARNSPLTTS